MRVGVSIITLKGFNIWNNGIGQNVYHLATLLRNIPFVEKVILINTGDQDYHPESTGELAKSFPLVSLKDSSDVIDVAIELSGAIDVEWTKRFRARGGKVVYHNCGQPYSALVEPTIFEKPSFFSDPTRCDVVWQLPKDEKFNSMMAGIHRCPVITVPYLWGPCFLDLTIKEIEAEGLRFGYQSGSLRRAVPSIFEPNISPIKTGLIPFLICEAAVNRKNAILEHVNFLNGTHMASHPTFYNIVAKSKLYQENKLTITARDFFAKVMARGSNIVISHQLDCPQNYAYLDALYGYYPLVHNSEMFSEVGYFYPDSNVDIATDRLLYAIENHDKNLESYKAKCDSFIDKVSPENRNNVEKYSRALLSLNLKN